MTSHPLSLGRVGTACRPSRLWPDPQGRPETGILPADIIHILRSQVSALRSLARVFRYRCGSRANLDPEPEHLSLAPDRRDPRPENASRLPRVGLTTLGQPFASAVLRRPRYSILHTQYSQLVNRSSEPPGLSRLRPRVPMSPCPRAPWRLRRAHLCTFARGSAAVAPLHSALFVPPANPPVSGFPLS